MFNSSFVIVPGFPAREPQPAPSRPCAGAVHSGFNQRFTKDAVAIPSRERPFRNLAVVVIHPVMEECRAARLLLSDAPTLPVAHEARRNSDAHERKRLEQFQAFAV